MAVAGEDLVRRHFKHYLKDEFREQVAVVAAYPENVGRDSDCSDTTANTAWGRVERKTCGLGGMSRECVGRYRFFGDNLQTLVGGRVERNTCARGGVSREHRSETFFSTLLQTLSYNECGDQVALVTAYQGKAGR